MPLILVGNALSSEIYESIDSFKQLNCICEVSVVASSEVRKDAITFSAKITLLTRAISFSFCALYERLIFGLLLDIFFLALSHSLIWLAKKNRFHQ